MIVLLLRRRLPHVHHGVADVPCIVQLGAGEGFRRILVDHLGFRDGRNQVADQFGAVGRDLHDLRPVGVEHDPALGRRGRIVEMDDGAPRAADGVEGAPDQVVARLGQHLDGDVVRDHVLLDELAAEVEIGFRGRGEADLDLLEAHPAQQLEHAPLALRPHGLDQRLVAVAQVDRAPDRRLLDDLAGPGPVGQADRLEALVFVDRHGGHGTVSGSAGRRDGGAGVSGGAALYSGCREGSLGDPALRRWPRGL